MMLYSIPPHWRQVEESQLEEFLKTCADYVSDSYSNVRMYRFRYNDQNFALILGGKVFVDPSLLAEAQP